MNYENFNSGAPSFEGRGRFGKGGANILEEKLSLAPGSQIIFIGSVNCVRHRPYLNIGEYMQSGRASILSPTMSDFSTGRYLNQLEEAILEIAQERDACDFIVMCGCQWVILSTDSELFCEKMLNEHGINVVVYEEAHINER